MKYATAKKFILTVFLLSLVIVSPTYGQVIDFNSGSSAQSLKGTSGSNLQQQSSGLQGSSPQSLGTTNSNQVLTQNVPTLLSPTGLPIRSESEIPVQSKQVEKASGFPKGIILAVIFALVFLFWIQTKRRKI